MPDYKLIPDNTDLVDLVLDAKRIIEFTPQKDGLPNRPIMVRIDRILSNMDEYSIKAW